MFAQAVRLVVVDEFLQRLVQQTSLQHRQARDAALLPHHCLLPLADKGGRAQEARSSMNDARAVPRILDEPIESFRHIQWSLRRTAPISRSVQELAQVMRFQLHVKHSTLQHSQQYPSQHLEKYCLLIVSIPWRYFDLLSDAIR